jgi:hypothetical protein
MAREKTNQETMSCPVARIFSELEKTYGSKSTFFNHLHQSQVEFLKAKIGSASCRERVSLHV